jgi:hypothetical protein
MDEFYKALMAGSNQLDEVRRTRKAIDEIIESVSMAVQRFTNGQITLSKMYLDPDSYDVKTSQLFIDRALSKRRLQESMNMTKASEAHNVIVLKRRGYKAMKVLARWKQDPSGLPCTINCFGYEIICRESRDISTAFQQILKNPVFFEVLQEMNVDMNRGPSF